MDKDQVKGGAKDIAGKAQEKFGEATDNASQQAKGLGKQVEGKAQKGLGDLKDSAKKSGNDDTH